MLTRLVRLNHERAREEAGGYVRYLRPAYQAPSPGLPSWPSKCRPCATPCSKPSSR